MDRIVVGVSALALLAACEHGRPPGQWHQAQTLTAPAPSGIAVRPAKYGGTAEPRYIGTVYFDGVSGFGATRGVTCSDAKARRVACGPGMRGAGGTGGVGLGGWGAGGGGSGHGGGLGRMGTSHGDANDNASVEGPRRDLDPSSSAYAEIQLPYRDGAARFLGRPEHVITNESSTPVDHLSTFAVDVDTAAYAIARRTLLSRAMPTPTLIRPEEFLNYFQYDYRPPKKDRGLFSIEVDGASSPLEPDPSSRYDRHLLRVGLMARPLSNRERQPANLVFLVDTSCSMTSPDKLDLAKKSLQHAVRNLRPDDRVAITTYAGGVSLVLEPTYARHAARIIGALEGLESAGGTAMESGLMLAYEQAARMQTPHSSTRIIVCSDGDANIGRTTPDELLVQIADHVDAGVTLSTIGYGDGNYRDAMMEQLANRGNGNYFYVDSPRQAERVFGRDLNKMIQDVAQDVKIQVAFDSTVVARYRLVGYDNRAVADEDFRRDEVDAGEIGAGHQVTALYELDLVRGGRGRLGTVAVRAKKPGGRVAKESTVGVDTFIVKRPFHRAPADFRFATAVVGAAELLRDSPYAKRWSYDQVLSIAEGARPDRDADRREFIALVKTAATISRPSGRQ